MDRIRIVFCHMDRSTQSNDIAIDRTSLTDSWSLLSPARNPETCNNEVKREKSKLRNVQKTFANTNELLQDLPSFHTRVDSLTKRNYDPTNSDFLPHEYKNTNIPSINIRSDIQQSHTNEQSEWNCGLNYTAMNTCISTDTNDYKYDSDFDFESDDDILSKSDSKLPENLHEEDFIKSADEDYILDEDLFRDDYSSTDTMQASPMNNLFMNHPHYNTHNPGYLKSSLFKYIMKYGQNQINLKDTDEHIYKCLLNTTFKIPVKMIEVPIIAPDQRHIMAAGDTGSDIQAIGINTILYYRSINKIKRDPKGIDIATGNGALRVHHYLPVTVKAADNTFITTKFWCLESLPFDWLVGNTLLHQLGYELTNQFHEYKHAQSNLDHVEDELLELACSKYPHFEREPDIDISQVNVGKAALREFVHDTLRKHRKVIAKHEFDSGLIPDMEFTIDFIEGSHPLKGGFLSKEYFMNSKTRTEMTTQIKGLHDRGYISKCKKPQYVSSIFGVPKKTGDIRIVFDFRKLNKITERLQYPIPRTRDLLQRFKGKNFITSLDMKGGYWHIPVAPKDRHKLAFIFDGEIYEWNVMPFGPTNSPMYFQQCMERIFYEECKEFTTVYIDDISIISNTLAEHKRHLKKVFEVLDKHCIKLRLDKCIWGVDQTEYLGFIVNKDSIRPKPDYIKKIMDVELPKNKTKLRRFLGMANFLHDFSKNLHPYTRLLSELTRNNMPDTIVWNEKQLHAFNHIKSQLQSIDHLEHYDTDKDFYVFTDASKYGIGGMLAQRNDSGVFVPIAYCSKVFSDTQTRWHVSEQELYAVIYCVEKWAALLQFRKFEVHTDHKNLETLFNKCADFKKGKLFRWAVRLQDFDFVCKYIKGEDNVVADWLSRESVHLQHPQYALIKDFYDSCPNKTRQKHSNKGGIDILAMYSQHLHLSILNQSTANHYFQTNPDPYSILDNISDTIYGRSNPKYPIFDHQLLDNDLYNLNPHIIDQYKSFNSDNLELNSAVFEHKHKSNISNLLYLSNPTNKHVLNTTVLPKRIANKYKYTYTDHIPKEQMREWKLFSEHLTDKNLKKESKIELNKRFYGKYKLDKDGLIDWNSIPITDNDIAKKLDELITDLPQRFVELNNGSTSSRIAPSSTVRTPPSTPELSYNDIETSDDYSSMSSE